MSLSSGFDTFKSATYWKATSKLGKETWLDSTFNEPMNIRLNLQVGGSMPNWYQKPVGSIPAGQGDFVVDYVRFYKKTA